MNRKGDRKESDIDAPELILYMTKLRTREQIEHYWCNDGGCADEIPEGEGDWIYTQEAIRG